MRPYPPRQRPVDGLSLVAATALTAAAVATVLGALVPRTIATTRDPSPPVDERIA